jgi:hypothetical protein
MAASIVGTTGQSATRRGADTGAGIVAGAGTAVGGATADVGTAGGRSVAAAVAGGGKAVVVGGGAGIDGAGGGVAGTGAAVGGTGRSGVGPHPAITSSMISKRATWAVRPRLPRANNDNDPASRRRGVLARRIMRGATPGPA